MCRVNAPRDGSILIILLWMLMVMSILCLSFAKTVRVEANALINTRSMASAYYLAYAGISQTVYKMVVYRLEAGRRAAEPETELEPRDIDLGKVMLKTDLGDVEVEVYDEDGKININRASKDILLSLLLSLGVDEGRADMVSDSILDWCDADSDYHANGAESDYYMTLENPYLAKNAQLDTTEELLLIQGVDAKLFYGYTYEDETGRLRYMPGLNRCVTVYGTSAGININSAPYQVMIAIGFTPEMAQKVIVERSQKPFKDHQDYTTRVPESPGMEMLKAPVVTRPPGQSFFVSLVSTARMKDSKIKKTIFAIVRLNARYPLKHSVVYWNENYYMQENEFLISGQQE